MSNDKPIGEISLEDALDVMTGARPSAEVLGAPAVDGVTVRHIDAGPEFDENDGFASTSAREHLEKTVFIVKTLLAEGERFFREEGRSKAARKLRTGKLRRVERADLLRDLEKAIDEGVAAGVAWVVYGDSESEDEGITALREAAPMVVELQALRSRVYRLLRSDGG